MARYTFALFTGRRWGECSLVGQDLGNNRRGGAGLPQEMDLEGPAPGDGRVGGY